MDLSSSSSPNLNDKSNNEENIELLQLPIATGNLENGSTLQYHLKAENGQISYKILNVVSPDKKKKSSKNSISTVTFDPNLISLQKMNSSQPTLKRKITSTNQAATKEKDEKRSKHNEIERKRRDKINNWIIKLSKIVPDCNDTGKQAQSKGAILSKTCDYIQSLLKNNLKLNNVLEENNKLRKELNEYKKENCELESEIDDLKELLKKNGILIKESK